MSLRFGTDGVRGVANTQLTAEFALALARASARVLRPAAVYVGRDTRLSGPMLEAAVCAGFASEGVDVVTLGVAPTPMVASLSAARGYAGAMISASHNPFEDNGIKLFAVGGTKLSDEQQADIEVEMSELAAPHRRGGDVGSIGSVDGFADYVGSVVATGHRLDGLRVVLDLAHGAAVRTGPEVFSRLGAAVTTINDAPNGRNINDGCGATQPEAMRDEVLRQRADVGFAFDGDADRCVAIDADGTVIDGDQLIAVLARELALQGALANNTVVVTVMANLGFHRAMASAGISVVETAVGDRAVFEAMEAGGHVLGGEQSGHVILKHLANTGDGVLTAVQFASAMARSGSSAADLAAVMERLPQQLINVRLARRDDRLMAALRPAIEQAQAELGDGGRVLVRPSGTEPLLRVMVEAPTLASATACAQALAERASAIAAEIDTVP